MSLDMITTAAYLTDILDRKITFSPFTHPHYLKSYPMDERNNYAALVANSDQFSGFYNKVSDGCLLEDFL